MRILKLCKRLNKFSLDEIEMISEIDLEELRPIINILIEEERLAYCDGTYYYNKKVCKKQQISKLPLFFEFHKKQDIEYIIKGFCTDIEVLKMIDLFGFTKHVTNKYYSISVSYVPVVCPSFIGYSCNKHFNIFFSKQILHLCNIFC